LRLGLDMGIRKRGFRQSESAEVRPPPKRRGAAPANHGIAASAKRGSAAYANCRSAAPPMSGSAVKRLVVPHTEEGGFRGLWFHILRKAVPAFYDAYRADSWAGAGARAHRGLPAGGREPTAVT
jgi:hypothetical protein